MLNAVEELRFWTGIMSNHGEFILTSLSYSEREAIQAALYYKEAFARLHAISESLAGASDTAAVNQLADQCSQLLAGFMNFKRLLLRRSMSCKLDSSLTPSFYNHMLKGPGPPGKTAHQ